MESRNSKNGVFHLGFGKFSLDIASSNLLTILVFLGLFALVLGAGHAQLTFVRNANADHAAIRAEQTFLRNQLLERLDAMTYMLSLPEAVRPALIMPHNVRERLQPVP